METLFNYFWLIAIGTNFLNSVIGWFRAQKHIRQNPALKSGYIKLIRGFFICMSLPWLVMGFGLETKQVASLADYLKPQVGNQAIMAWWISLWALSIFYSLWIWRCNGTEKLVKYPGLLRGNPKNPAMIKLTWSFSMVGALVAHMILFFYSPVG